MSNLFVVAIIYMCNTSAMLDCELISSNKWAYRSNEPMIIRDNCDKWLANRMRQIDVLEGQIVHGKCKLMLIGDR